MNITGYVYYTPESCAMDILNDLAVNGTGDAGTGMVTLHAQHGIPGIPVVIATEQLATTEYACAITDLEGKYTFTNVPAGSADAPVYYKVVEAFGFSTTETNSTIDFTAKKQQLPSTTIIEAKDPTVKYILDAQYVTKEGVLEKFLIYNANRIVSLYPNTVFIKADGTHTYDMAYLPEEKNIDKLNFKDAPQKQEPLVISDFLRFQNARVKGPNVITAANQGAFGNVPVGTRHSSTYTGTAAFDGQISDFTCQAYGTMTPAGNSYAITNIASSGTYRRSWFDTASYTDGDETGRFMLVNGDTTTKVFFRDNITIEPNTAYLFSFWCMNLIRLQQSAKPVLFLKVSNATTGEMLAMRPMDQQSSMEVTQIPTWNQLGLILTPEDINQATELTVEFISNGMEQAGNDFAIDDVSVEPLTLGVSAFKQVQPELQSVKIGDKIAYSCIISNSADNDAITHVMFKDFVQNGVEIDMDSFTITCSQIINEPFEPSGSAKEPSVDDAGIDIGRVLSEKVQETDPYYVPLKLEKIPPGVTVVIRFTVSVKAVNSESGYSNVKNRFRIQFLSENDNQDMTRPRIVSSNEVVTPVIFVQLSTEKSLSEINDSTRTEIDHGGSVLDNSDVVYSIKIINSGKLAADGIILQDAFEELFSYVLPEELTDCKIRVTTQIESPPDQKEEEEQKVPCTSIFSYGEHGIEIQNLSVPGATDTDKGICTVRIYGKLKM